MTEVAHPGGLMRRIAFAVAVAAVLAVLACGGPLTWQGTCGPPVAQGCNPDGAIVDAGPTTCGTNKLGDPCSLPGTTCTVPGCNGAVTLVCDTHGPTNCPISRAKYKREISFVDEAQLSRYRDELVTLPLATYRYRGDEKQRLGFMIDETEGLVAVDAPHDQVDLYSYTSMAVAALKVQQQELAAMRREVDQLKAEVAACKRRR
jgi:hypothetical protein